jgi:hypothetical protein
VKLLELVPVPYEVVTETVPVVPDPTTTVIEAPLFEVIDVTAVPPILTLAAVAPVRLVPLMVNVDPTQPLEGLIEVIVGSGVKSREKSSKLMYQLLPVSLTLIAK